MSLKTQYVKRLMKQQLPHLQRLYHVCLGSIPSPTKTDRQTLLLDHNIRESTVQVLNLD
jgi:hypothetical protein